MILGAPKEVQDALELLWKYSEDACFSGRTKEEAEKEGYECSTSRCHFVTFCFKEEPYEGD